MKKDTLKEINGRDKIIILLGIVVIVLIIVVLKPWGRNLVTDQQTIKLKFENIGELATQVSYSTEVGTIKDSRNLFGWQIPFTQSSYIYSYDFVIKAGFDFADIEWIEEGRQVIVRMPEPKVLSNEIELDSLKIYVEDESAFTNIKLEDTNSNTQDMQKQAEKTSIDNGLFDLAKTNAETLIEAFLSNQYDFGEKEEQYRICFEYAKGEEK